jgi:hypothetical protein
VFFETSSRKDDVWQFISRSLGGDEVNGSREMAGLAGWIFELHIVLDTGIHDG